jgi:chain length determinant protein EpsF
MTIGQVLRVLLARKWLFLGLFVLVALAGSAYTLTRPKIYVASASLVVDARPDPLLGALALPASMATQVVILKSDRVATRVVKILGVERSPEAVQQWREATNANIPLDRYFAELLVRGLVVESGQGSNVIDVTFSAEDPAFATSAANAFVQSAIQTSIELQIDPARQSTPFVEAQLDASRKTLEEAQRKLSDFQQSKGIVVSEQRVDDELAKLDSLSAQLATAQLQQIESSGRQRDSGTEVSPDVQQSSAVQSLKAQLASAELRLAEVRDVMGTNHPQRQQIQAQIDSLKQQISDEVRRVSGGTAVVSRANSKMVNELQALVDAQKKKALGLRADKDQAAILERDVATANRAYEALSQRSTQLNLESQNNKSPLRVLSVAVEPNAPSLKVVVKGVVLSCLGGLLAGFAVAMLLEFLDRRVRSPEDLTMLHGVPVIGVLTPAGSKRRIFRRLGTTNAPTASTPLLSGSTRQ